LKTVIGVESTMGRQRHFISWFQIKQGELNEEEVEYSVRKEESETLSPDVDTHNECQII